MNQKIPEPDEELIVRLERRGIFAEGTLYIFSDNSAYREHFKKQLREIGFKVISTNVLSK